MLKIYFFTFFIFSFLSLGLSAPALNDYPDWPPLNFYTNLSLSNATLSNYSYIQSYAFLFDSNYYVTADNCGNLSFWNFSTSHLEFQYQLPLGSLNGSNLSLICSLPNRSISNLLVLENSKKIAFSAGNVLYIFDIANNKTSTINYHSQNIISLTFLRKRNWFVSADSSGSLAFWDPSGNLIQNKNVYFQVSQVESEYDSNFLLVFGDNYLISIINIESNQVMKTYRTYRVLKTVTDLKFTDYIALVYQDNGLDIVNKHNWKIVQSYNLLFINIVDLSFDYTNNLLSVAGDQKIIWINITDFSSTTVLRTDLKIVGNQVFTDKDLWSYLAVEFEHNVTIYRFETHPHPHDKNSTYIVSKTEIWNISFDGVTSLLHYSDKKNNKEFLVVGDNTGHIQILNITTGNNIATYSDHYSRPINVLIQITNTTLIAFGLGKDIIVWDVELYTIYRNLSGHTDNITSLVYILDSDRLVSGSLDGFAKIWEISCCVKQTIYISNNGIKALDIIENTDILLVISQNDENIQYWNLTSGKIIACFDANQKKLTSILNLPNTLYFLTSGSDNSTYIRNKYTRDIVKIFQSYNSINSYSYEKYMQLLLLASANSLKVLDVENFNMSYIGSENSLITEGLLFYPELMEGPYDDSANLSYIFLIDSTPSNLQAYNLTISWGDYPYSNQTNHSDLLILINEDQKNDDDGSILCYGYSPSLKYTITGDSKGYLKFWNATEGRLIAKYKTDSDRVEALQVLDPDNLLAYSEKDKIVIFSMQYLTKLNYLNDHLDNITSLSYVNDINALVSASLDGTVKIWANDNTAVKSTIYSFIKGVSQVVYNSFMDVVVCAGYYDSYIKIYKLTGEKMIQFEHDVVSVKNLIDLKEKGIAYIGLDETVYIYNIMYQKKTTIDLDYVPTDITYDNYHNTLVISNNYQVLIYNFTNQRLNSVINESAIFTSISSSYEVIEDSPYRLNTILIEETGRNLKFWNVTYNDNKNFTPNGSNDYLDYLNSFVFPGGTPNLLLYINSGSVLIVGSYAGFLNFYETNSGKLLKSIQVPTGFLTNLIKVSDEGSLVAVSSLNFVYVYNTTDYSLYARTYCSLLTVKALAYENDRKYIDIGDSSGFILFWNISSKVCQNDTIKAHEQGVNSLEYLGNRQLLSSGYLDNTVKLWNLGNNTLINSFVGPAGAVVIGRLLDEGDNSALIEYLESENFIITCGYGAIYIWDKSNVTIAKSVLVNKTIQSVQSINDKNTLVVSTFDSVFFLNVKDYNLSLISKGNDSLSAITTYKNNSDGKNYLVQGKSSGNIQVYQIVKYSGDGNDPSNNKGGSEDSSKAWIAGVVIGALAAIIIIGIIIACIIKKNRKKNEDHGYKQFNDTQVTKGKQNPSNIKNEESPENEENEENQA